ncbi:hypothetical protein KBC04_00410 [Candidatus Babeliales bacterium]|nr:hypothetical protein [Candidatus Babeliales bacterium]MBP9843446.1 hypothetical protein [Candidatus Babeliales bacterium]
MNRMKKVAAITFLMTLINFLEGMEAPTKSAPQAKKTSAPISNRERFEQEQKARDAAQFKSSKSSQPVKPVAPRKIEPKRKIATTSPTASQQPISEVKPQQAFEGLNLRENTTISKPLSPQVKNAPEVKDVVETSKSSAPENQAPAKSQQYFNQEKMEAPISSYAAQANKLIKKEFPSVPARLRELFTQPLSIEFIDVYAHGYTGGSLLGYNKVAVESVALPHDWKDIRPSNLQKISAGLEALQNIYKKTPQLDRLYLEGHKDTFMTEPIEKYIDALQERFPHAPQELIEIYVKEFLRENTNRYHRKGITSLFAIDPHNPITTSPADVIKNPEWPQETNSQGDFVGRPSELQKLYLSLQALDYIGIKASASPSFTSTLLSAPRIAYSQGIGAAASNVTNHPAVKKFVNDTAEQILLTGSDALVAPAKPVDPTAQPLFEPRVYDAGKRLVNTAAKQGIESLTEVLDAPASPANPTAESFFGPEVQKAGQVLVNKAGNKAVQAVASAAQSVAEQSLLPRSESKPGEKSYIELDATSNKAISEAKQALSFAATTHVERAFESINEILAPEKKQVEKSKETDKDIANKSLLNPEKSVVESYLKAEKKVTEIKKSLDRIAIPTMKEYFINKFKKTAQTIKKSPAELKNFIQKIARSFSTMTGMNKEQTAALVQEAEKEAEILIKDKESWFNAEGKDFDVKFKKWMNDFVNKMNSFVGKEQPKNIQIIQLQAKENNPLSPQVTISWNKITEEIIGIEVTYKGNSYKIDLNDPKNDFHSNIETGSFSIKTPLLKDGKEQNAFQAVNNILYNSVITNNLFEPLRATAVGKSLGKQKLNEWEYSLTVPSYIQEGVMTIEYNPTTSSIKTEVNKTMPDSSQIKTTKEYSTKETSSHAQQAQIIEVDGTLNDIYTPAIKIKYTPSSTPEGLGVLESVHLDYTNPLTQKTYEFSQEKTFNEKTGTYTIIATPTIPVTPATTIIAAAFKKTLSNASTTAYTGLIESFENTFSGAGLQRKYPQAYADVKQWLLGDYATGIEKVIIEYNPTENVVATRVINTMAQQGPQVTTLIYPVN